MNHDKEIDDGYEENPWDDVDGENLRVIEDFLPTPSSFANAKTYIISDEKALIAQDLRIIERMAAEKNLTPTSLIAGVLHDFVSGQLVRRGE